MKNLHLLFVLFFTLLSFESFPQKFFIPDVNFRTFLNNEFPTFMDTTSDSLITDSAVTYTGALDCSFLNINDLSGVEYFVNVTKIECVDNGLTTLDISSNIALTYLWCDANQLTSLDISSNTALIDLRCSHNQLTSINVTANTFLEYLDCSNNQLLNTDISNNITLTEFHCGGNSLLSLETTTNTALEVLSFRNNFLTSIDLSANTALTRLYCHYNQLISLDLSASSALRSLWCFQNSLTDLDLSANSALETLRCSSNQLTFLDVKNGNNINMLGYIFYANNNPNLGCIEVDDVIYSTNNWSNIDTQTFFSEDCSSSISKKEAIIFNIYPNPSTGLFNIQIKDLEKLEIYNLNGVLIESTKQNDIDLRKQVKGIYFVKVITANGTETKKVLLE